MEIWQLVNERNEAVKGDWVESSAKYMAGDATKKNGKQIKFLKLYRKICGLPELAVRLFGQE